MMIRRTTLALSFALLTMAHLTAMEKEVKEIDKNDQSSPQLTFHQFPELPAETQQETLTRFIPAELAQTENVLALFKRVGELAMVSTTFAQSLIECLKNPALLEQALKDQIPDSLLCKGYVLRTISRALVKDRLVAFARTLLERKPLKKAEKMLARTLGELQLEITVYPQGAVRESAIDLGSPTPLGLGKLKRFQELLLPAVQDLCPEITLLVGAYLKRFTPGMDHYIKGWVSKCDTITDDLRREAEKSLINQLFNFSGSDTQLRTIIECRSRHNVRFHQQNDLNNYLITSPEALCREIMTHPEKCLSTLLKYSDISDTYKRFLTALRDGNMPMLRSLVANDLNTYLRDVLLSFALCYAIGKNDAALIQTLLAYSLSPEMLLLVLELAIEREFPSFRTILAHLEVSSNKVVQDKLNANLISYITDQAYRQDIVMALCSKLNYPAAIMDCIEACMRKTEEPITSNLILSDMFDKYSIQIVILMLIKNGDQESIDILRTTLTKIFQQNLDDIEVGQRMHTFIRLAESHNQQQVAENLRTLYRESLVRH